MSQSRYVVALSFVGVGLVAFASACGDDDDTSNTSSGGYAGTTAKAGSAGAMPGGGTGGDPSVGGTNAGGTSVGGTGGSTGGAGGSAGAGPTLTTMVGSTGTIFAAKDVTFAGFYQDDTIVHTSEEPGCVTYFRSVDKPLSSAGNVILGGDHFGKTGGPPSAITISPNTGMGNIYELFLEPPTQLFPDTEALRLQIEKTATNSLPAIAVTTLRTPTQTPVNVKTPVVPSNNTLDLKASQDLEITWDAPPPVANDSLPPGRIVFAIKNFSTVDKAADVWCGFDAAKGSARVPMSLFKEIRTRLPKAAGSDPKITGARIHIWFGDQREIRSDTSSYVIEVTRPDSTNFGEQEATLDE